MRFRAHETFFIRKGWLSKGIKNVLSDPTVFMGTNGNPMDILGIGSNMVKALRYWLQAVGLTKEPTSGKREQRLTEFGELVRQHDPYLEELGTLWLLHYHLAKNSEEATAWYFFFNEFKFTEFDRDDFVRQLAAYVRIEGEDASERSLEDDFNCIINTYLPRSKASPEKAQPESNIDCPLGELGLIDIADKKKRTFRKVAPSKDVLHPLIVLAIILDQAGENKEVKISAIQNDKLNAGKVFNLDIIALTAILSELERMQLIKVVRTAGLDVIKIKTQLDFAGCVQEYYKTLDC